MKKCLAKLRGCIGESIAETLVALLISSLALLMLAGAVSAANRVITASTTKMDKYYAADNALAVNDVKVKGGTVTVVLTEKEEKEDQFEQTFSDVPYYVNNTFGSNPTIMYSFEIPTSGE